MNRRRDRKHLFLSTTILRGRLLKNPDDGIEVGGGFAQATENEGREAEPAAPAASPPNPDPKDAPVDGTGKPADGGADDGNGDGEDNGEDDDGAPAADEDPKKAKRKTADFVRDLKKDNRELRRTNAALDARLAALEKGGLPNAGGDDNSDPTSEKPDANDAKKYPLGVLDDGYIHDMIEYTAGEKVAAVMDARLQREREQAEQAAAETQLVALREKAVTLTEAGEDLHDDFTEVVLEAGLRGDWQLTETTFTAATEATHGAEILYALANDKAEAKRVAALSPFQQLKYVSDKDAEISGTAPKPRNKPQAGAPPQDAPRGRNASNPIRADTDNLDDFRKLFYK